MRAKQAAADACPCGLPGPYAACCGRFLDGGLTPVTAEELMRSRYVAYAQRREEYLLRTWHPSTRPAWLDLEKEAVRWLGLKVIRTRAGGAEDDTGTVEFVARYKVGGFMAHRLREESRFVREEGQWRYLDADGAV